MREIKFRAWDTYSAKMHYKFTIGSVTNPNDNLWTCPTVWIEDRGWVNCDTFELMQYTGLKDKNGVEIYEGDILKWQCSKSGSKKIKEYVVEIYFGAHGYQLTIYDEGERWATGSSLWNAINREVIGNIYEHPHLLHVKDAHGVR